MTAEKAKSEAHLVVRSTNKCAAAIEKRKADMLAKPAGRLRARRAASEHVNARDLMQRDSLHYTTIQNNTYVLAPDIVWGPYGHVLSGTGKLAVKLVLTHGLGRVDGEINRHDLRETKEGIDFYLDIGVIDIETCEPLQGTALTIWNCNATGSYSSFTGVDPDTSELLDGWKKRADGTTDDETFLRGMQATDENGIVEFLTKSPTNITNGTSYSASSVQHIGQLFFEEDLLDELYATEPYSEHLGTLNRTTNAEDSLYSDASSDDYSAVISVRQLTDDIADGLVGYITVGVNSSAVALAITGGGVNLQGYLSTGSVDVSKLAQATGIDRGDGCES